MDKIQAIMGNSLQNIGATEWQSWGLSHTNKPIAKGNLKH